MSDRSLWVTEAETRELLGLGEAIDVLADAHLARAAGDAANMSRTHVGWGEAILHAVGGVAGDLAGTKTWMYTPRGAAPLIVLFRVEDGRPAGVIEAFWLGKIRTAATSGLGVRLLAREDADVLALLGTGKQALEQARAVAHVRALRSVRVFGRDAARREAFVARAAEALGVRVTGHTDPAEAVRGASLVTTITRAADPIVCGAMLEPGMHLTAAGAIVPSRRELDESSVARCSTVAVDSLSQAQEDSGELRAAVETGALTWGDVIELGALIEGAAGRRSPGDITLFKALGVGLADVALGAEVLRRAADAGAGQDLPRHVHRELASTRTTTSERGC